MSTEQASYNRPFIKRGYRPVNMPLNAEYPMIRFLEANGYDVSYFSGVDSARRGELIRNHKVGSIFCVVSVVLWLRECSESSRWAQQKSKACRGLSLPLGF